MDHHDLDRRGVLAGLAAATFVSGPALAQGQARVTQALYVESLLSRIPQTIRQLRRFAGQAKDDGALSTVLLQELGRPERFVLYAVFADEAALKAHQSGAVRKGLDAAVAGSTQAPIDERIGTAITAEPLKASRGDLYVLTHIDVAPPGAADAAGWLKGQAAAALQTTGCHGFEVSVQAGRTNHFTVAHAWRDALSFADYAGRDDARRVRRQLNGIKGALYDERLYRAEG
jgi:quinol monooxygenase YgiN